MSQISEKQKRKRTKTSKFKTEDKTKISQAQIALLHVAKNELQLDDDTYRDMLENVAGVTSAVDMPRDKFDAVLSHLKACGFELRRKEGTAGKKKYDEFSRRAGMATPAQLRFIEVQFVEYLKLKGQPVDHEAVAFGLRHFLKKFYRAEDLRFLTRSAASDAIEGLKNTLIHEREKQARQGTPPAIQGTGNEKQTVQSGQAVQSGQSGQAAQATQPPQPAQANKSGSRPALRRVF